MAQQDALASIATELSKLAAGMEQLRVQNAPETAHRATMAQSIENLDQRLRGQEALLTGDGPSVLSTAEPVARPQEWTVTAADDNDAPITRAECAALITQALQDKVAPAMGAMRAHYGMQFQAHRQRIESLEQEVQKLKIRTAWVEKDVMYQQIEVAKRTLVLRGLPDWMLHADRELTVDKAVREAGLAGTDWDLTTSSMDDGQGSESSHMLTVPTFGIRKKLLDHSSRLYAWYWKEEKITATTTIEGADLSTITGFDQGVEKGSAQRESQPADGKGKDSQPPSQPTSTWFKQKVNGVVVKVSPGITQFERRLGAPLHGLMNAYQQFFKRFQKKSLVPKWKSLILTHPGKPMAGQSPLLQTPQLPHRSTNTSSYPSGGMCGTSSSDSRSIKRHWSSRRLRQPHSPHRFLTRSIPAYNAGEEQGIDKWLACFKYEYPSCQASTLIVSISQTCEMSALKQAVENAKISHIHHGDFPQTTQSSNGRAM